jgi:hypothetical protein
MKNVGIIKPNLENIELGRLLASRFICMSKFKRFSNPSFSREIDMFGREIDIPGRADYVRKMIEVSIDDKAARRMALLLQNSNPGEVVFNTKYEGSDGIQLSRRDYILESLVNGIILEVQEVPYFEVRKDYLGRAWLLDSFIKDNYGLDGICLDGLSLDMKEQLFPCMFDVDKENIRVSCDKCYNFASDEFLKPKVKMYRNDVNMYFQIN